MPYWMTNPDHGEMPVYSLTEVTQAQGNGWALLNHGESPMRAPVANGDAERALKAALAQSIEDGKSDPPLPVEPPRRKPGRPPKAK